MDGVDGVVVVVVEGEAEVGVEVGVGLNVEDDEEEEDDVVGLFDGECGLMIGLSLRLCWRGSDGLVGISVDMELRLAEDEEQADKKEDIVLNVLGKIESSRGM